MLVAMRRRDWESDVGLEREMMLVEESMDHDHKSVLLMGVRNQTYMLDKLDLLL